MARIAFQIDALDGVLGPIDLAVDDGVGGRLGRHGPEPQRHEHLTAVAVDALVPLWPRGRRMKRKIAVEGLERPQAFVGGQLVGWQRSRSVGIDRTG